MPAPALTACRPTRRHAALMKHGEYLPEADKGPAPEAASGTGQDNGSRPRPLNVIQRAKCCRMEARTRGVSASQASMRTKSMVSLV
ncbi:hypothetical protein GCM10018790_30800 [Kitasatospora xanthocidica]|nr:hypothetical protein GCM10018790_30800 [Kitasatospora xanthocidica]